MRTIALSREIVMAQQALAGSSQPCVWMCAGLLSYKLCNYDFDCEHCALDAALRGDAHPRWRGIGLLNPRAGSCVVPEDRFYSAGHTWARGEDSLRIGLDAFAAALLGSVRSITYAPVETRLDRTDTMCTIDLGIGQMELTAPFRGRIVRINEELDRTPSLLVRDPYDTGWLLELATEDGERELSSWQQARTQMCLDLRRFRRALAFRLLAEVTGKDRKPADAPQVNDLRDVIAGEGYVEFLREFVY